jgi:N-acetylneuraminic acid mutarotase
MKQWWMAVCLFFRVLRADEFTWETLPALPDKEGFAGAFAGVSQGVLLVAGGANFPDRMPWEGGDKVWYDSVLVLRDPKGTWEKVAKLSKPIGYGVSLTDDRGLICLGGGDAAENFKEVCRLEWINGRVEVKLLPSLPKSTALMSGVISGRKLYILGGVEKPTDAVALADCWMLNLDRLDQGWQTLPSFPGKPRILATMGTVNDSVFVFSGAALRRGADGKVTRDWLKDAWKFTITEGWQQLRDLPRVSVAAPSPAPIREGQFLVLGGDDGSLVHFEPIHKHPGFPRDILAYDWKNDSWSVRGTLPFSLVTTPCVKWHERILIPGGEARPGKRSPQIWWGIE